APSRVDDDVVARRAPGDARSARRRRRPLHASLGPRRPFTPAEAGEPRRPRLRLGPERRSPRRSASPWNRRRPDRLGHARLGKWASETELGPEEPLGAGPVRDRGREALPVGAQVGDLERAESARRALPELAAAVRPAAA